jgi:sulfofructose kinase
MKVICIGNVTYDITMLVDDFPTENNKYRTREKIENGGGSAANACYLLGKWNVKPYFAGVIGRDEFGQKIIKEFKDSNVNTKYLKALEEKTSLSFILSNKKNASRTIISYKNNRNKLGKIKEKFDVILLDGEEYEASLDLIDNNSDAITIIDAGRCTDKVVGLAKKCKYLVCSKNFAYSLTEIDNYELMYEKLEHIFKNIVVVTLGKEGTLVRIDGEIIVVPSINVDAVDETGAGDAFHAGFVYGLLQNWDLLKIVEFSNKAGAYATTKMGTKNSLEEVFYGYK